MAKKKQNRNAAANHQPPVQSAKVASVDNGDPAAAHTLSRGLSRGNTADMQKVLNDALGSDADALKDFPEEQKQMFAVVTSIFTNCVHLDRGRKSVWGAKPILGFEIAIQSLDDASVFTRLDIEIPPLYPKVGPVIRLVELQPNQEELKQAIKDVTDYYIKTQLGDEFMVPTILTDIQDKLNDEASTQAVRAAGISLGEERATTETAAQAQAASIQELALRQKQVEAAANETKLAEEVELRRRKRQLLDSSHSGIDDQKSTEEGYPDDCIVFKHDLVCHDRIHNSDISFRAVRPVNVFYEREGKRVMLACPFRNGILKAIPLVLKEIRLPVHVNDEAEYNSILSKVEDNLRTAKALDHDSIVKMYEYQLDQVNDRKSTPEWELLILTENAEGGSLTSLLDMVGCLPAAKLRTYARSILDALEYYDRKRYVHPAIHAHNVLFFGSEQMNYQAKLSDGYGTALRELIDKSQNKGQLSDFHQGNWAAPETISGEDARSSKTCIWELGVVLLQMALGNDMIKTYTSPEDALSRAQLDQDFDHLISRMCATSARKRPSAFVLQSDQFFKSHVQSVFKSQNQSNRNVPSLSRSRSVYDSRWALEWESLGRLGKGGFGIVVKARNRLDGHFYAVKQLKCKSVKDLDEIWSEVRMLAQLNHSGIVRYFGAWSEDDQQDTTETGSSFTRTDPRSFALATNSEALPSNIFAGPSTGHDFMNPSLSQIPDVETTDDEQSENHGEEASGVENDDKDESDDDGNMFAYQSPGSDTGGYSQAIESENGVEDEIPNDPFALQAVANNLDEEPDMFESDGASTPSLVTNIPSRPQPFKRGGGTPSAIRRPPQYYNRSSTLYIQMELCETGTLFDLIKEGLPDKVDDAWRIFRLVLDGLVHIHSMGVVHRDLKPLNIFIDARKMPKIGDFGLASPSQATIDGNQYATHVAGPMSKGIGTLFYIAPELENPGSGQYSASADMFALGVIFFEMCFPFKTSTERINWMQSINKNSSKLPPRFEKEEFQVQGRIIRSLLNHDQSRRPSAQELLLDPEIPEPLEEEKEQRFVQRLVHGDPEQFKRVLENFMSKMADRPQVLAYSHIDKEGFEQPDGYLLGSIKSRLEDVFHAHGAVEGNRQTTFPAEGFYQNAVNFLDGAGFAVQLPYDLTVPFARAIAVQQPKYGKSFSCGAVFRPRGPGVEPLCIPEVDFDIVSYSAQDLSLRDAQVISVLDDCLNNLGPLFVRSFSIVISHGDLLELALRACDVPEARIEATKRVLSNLNVAKTSWKQVQGELRSTQIGLSAACVAAISHFNFTDSFEGMRKRVLEALSRSKTDDAAIKATRTLNRLQEVDGYLSRLRVKTTVIYSPLSNTSEFLYRGSLMFKCVESKANKVVIVGGRYDALVRSYQTPTHKTFARAAGFRVNLLDLAAQARNDALPLSNKNTRSRPAIPPSVPARIDVVVTSFDEAILQSTCIDLTRMIFEAGIKVELSEPFATMDELDRAYMDISRYWVVIVRQVSNNQQAIKVRTPSRDENDVPTSDLVGYLREETGERQTLSSSEPILRRTRSSHGGGERENITILTPEHKSKKVNRAAIIDSARTAAQDLAETMSKTCRVLAIDTDDETLQRMRNTRLADGDSWRALKHAVSLTEREYISEIQEQLRDWCKEGQDGAFICNYKTRSCIFYDFGKV